MSELKEKTLGLTPDLLKEIYSQLSIYGTCLINLGRDGRPEIVPMPERYKKVIDAHGRKQV